MATRPRTIKVLLPAALEWQPETRREAVVDLRQLSPKGLSLLCQGIAPCEGPGERKYTSHEKRMGKKLVRQGLLVDKDCPNACAGDGHYHFFTTRLGLLAIEMHSALQRLEGSRQRSARKVDSRRPQG